MGFRISVQGFQNLGFLDIGVSGFRFRASRTNRILRPVIKPCKISATYHLFGKPQNPMLLDLAPPRLCPAVPELNTLRLRASFQGVVGVYMYIYIYISYHIYIVYT